ncbi:MAG: asparagine synthase-related protein [Alphaproteobacteria bacterium]
MALAGETGHEVTPDRTQRMLATLAIAPGRRSRFERLGGAMLGGTDGAEVRRWGDDMLVAFDGRLDNTDELRRTLGSGAVTAMNLVALAYRRWGEDFLDPLVGDFACAVWDGGLRRLFFGCDAMGARPLHYWMGAERLLFASEPRGLLALPEVPRVMNERWVAERLALLPMLDEATAYRDIRRIPPGHVAVVEGGTVHLHRYWRPETLTPLRLAGPAEYAEAVRASLDQAVACRLPPTGLVGANLSAGLDSGSIVSLAARRLAAEGRRLTAFTAVPDPGFSGYVPPGAIADEGPLAAEVARAYPNIDHVRIPNLNGDRITAFDRFNAGLERPVMTTGGMAWGANLFAEARGRGVTVLLNGDGGNMSISHDGLTLLPTLLRQGRLIDLVTEMLALHRHGVWGWRGMVNLVVGPFLPAWLRRWLFLVFRRGNGQSLADFSPLSPRLAGELGIDGQIRRSGGNLFQAARHDSLAGRLAAILRNDHGMAWAGVRRMYGIERCAPALDRRVVELCLRIPDDQFLHHGETRALIRRAMDGILPNTVRLVRSRGLQNADWTLGLATSRAEYAREVAWMERSDLARHCLDVPRLRRLVDEWPDGGWHRDEVIRAYQLVLARGVAAARFLRRFDQGNE